MFSKWRACCKNVDHAIINIVLYCCISFIVLCYEMNIIMVIWLTISLISFSGDVYSLTSCTTPASNVLWSHEEPVVRMIVDEMMRCIQQMFSSLVWWMTRQGCCDEWKFDSDSQCPLPVIVLFYNRHLLMFHADWNTLCVRLNHKDKLTRRDKTAGW